MMLSRLQALFRYSGLGLLGLAAAGNVVLTWADVIPPYLGMLIGMAIPFFAAMTAIAGLERQP